MIPHFPRSKRGGQGDLNRGGFRKSFRSLLNYLFDERQHPGEEITLAHGTLSGTNPRELSREFGLSRALRSEVERPVWHVALNPAPEDREVWADPERRREIIQAFVQRTILKEWENRCAAQAKAGRANPPERPDPEAYQWCGIEHGKAGAFDRPPHVHLVLSRIGLDGRLWYANQDARAAAEVCRELEREYGLRELHRGGDHRAWTEPEQIRAVDGTGKALLDRGERDYKAETAAAVRAAIAAIERGSVALARDGAPAPETRTSAAQAQARDAAEQLLARELLRRGVQLERAVNSQQEITGYRLTGVDGEGRAVTLPDGTPASWSGSKLGFKRDRTIERTLEQWARTRELEPDRGHDPLDRA